MIYGSVCSGIEAATMAWHPLGWTPAFFSEIEKFPSQVLAHHYGSNMPGEQDAINGVPNHGDMTKFQEWPDHAIDLLVGGTPCQSFSVAGLRKGLADPRGNLMLTYLAIAARYRPRWLVWENVPGALSSWSCPDETGDLQEGEEREVEEVSDFGCLLEGLQQLGYGFAYRVLDAQFIRVDGFGRAVPQRRRRVFVVGYLGDWRRAAAVLLEPQGLRGDPAPCRSAGQGFATDVVPSLTASGSGVERSGNTRGQDPVVAVAASLMAKDGRGVHSDMDTFVTTRSVAATLNRGAESRGKGGYAGRRQEDDDNLVAFDTTQITSKANRSVPKAGDPCHPLAAGAHPPAIAFNSREDPEVTFDRTGPLGASTPQAQAIAQGWAVRRLTPRECERLQGFPDDFTDIRAKGKPTADGPRYKALGNSMAVNAMRWIGRRIQFVDRLTDEEGRAA